MVELLIELNKEANESNKQYFVPLGSEKIDYDKVEEITYLGNKCIYSFIRILYKKGIIPKETIIEKLKNYDCKNLYLNAFFLPKIIESNPKSINLMILMNYNKMNKHNYKL